MMPSPYIQIKSDQILIMNIFPFQESGRGWPCCLTPKGTTLELEHTLTRNDTTSHFLICQYPLSITAYFNLGHWLTQGHALESNIAGHPKMCNVYAFGHCWAIFAGLIIQLWQLFCYNLLSFNLKWARLNPPMTTIELWGIRQKSILFMNIPLNLWPPPPSPDFSRHQILAFNALLKVIFLPTCLQKVVITFSLFFIPFCFTRLIKYL